MGKKKTTWTKSSGKRPSPWTEAERAILEPYKPAFRAADKEGRKALLGDQILPDFLNLHTNVIGLEHDVLKRKVKEWFSNTGHTKKTESKFLLLPCASLAKVLLHEKKAKIDEETRKRTSKEPGDPEYLGHHRQAQKHITDQLGDEGMEEMLAIQEQWEQEGWPCELQQREAVQKGDKLSRSMDVLRHKRLGQRLITFVWYPDEKGIMGVELLDFNNTIGRCTVERLEDKFGVEVNEFTKVVWEYTSYITQEESGVDLDEDPVQHRTTGKKRPLPTMDRSDEGFPVLPEPCEDEKDLQYKKDLVWAFLTEHYVLATGRKNTSVPFSAVSTDNTKWANAKYWPPEVTLTDSSRMNTHELILALDFWKGRALLALDDTFCFTLISAGHRGNTRTMPALYSRMGHAADNVDAVGALQTTATEGCVNSSILVKNAGLGSRKIKRPRKKSTKKGKRKEPGRGTVADNMVDIEPVLCGSHSFAKATGAPPTNRTTVIRVKCTQMDW